MQSALCFVETSASELPLRLTRTCGASSAFSPVLAIQDGITTFLTGASSSHTRGSMVGEPCSEAVELDWLSSSRCLVLPDSDSDLLPHSQGPHESQVDRLGCSSKWRAAASDAPK